MIRTLTLAALAAVAAAPMALAQAQPGAAPAEPRPGTAPAQVRPGAPPIGGTTTTTTTTRATGGRAAVNDSLFAYAAANAGQAEISLSELGVQKATDPELKRFSQQMIQDHNRLNGQLMTVAQQQGLQLPRTPDFRAQFCAQSLSGLSGEEFDRCYAKAQLVAHMETLAMFEAEAERGANPNIKAVASQGVPHIKEHLKTIKPIAMKYMKDMKDTKDEHEHSDSPAPERRER